jgi:hypothetical protein
MSRGECWTIANDLLKVHHAANLFFHEQQDVRGFFAF